MKKIFLVSQVLFAINIVILIIIPAIFLFLFSIFPNLDSSENGLGAYPLACFIWGIAGLMLTIPFAVIMAIIYVIYEKYNNQ
ncbi:hypothetical protein A5819_000926 [Enterococcus sp. 7E2_DIV0204]|uniref:Uncharacterized protein n=1 Tax=Enterococcus plantarum TaxID=1077675 RepID=A0A2W4B9N8_9ENTE|nr:MULTISPECIES: hypothetical protein [unclassified Enterococcus]OTN88445.1 hypothetical protein A5819_000926 [Enterococcus sp. 7E2_DIV0204]OTP50918.1 hypothetical protein A5884_000104 [Enterococcus sp. 7D2_DIV0200]PZL73015.1 hypothetical protein CI088_09680 [Enterococcus plantarum]